MPPIIANDTCLRRLSLRAGEGCLPTFGRAVVAARGRCSGAATTSCSGKPRARPDCLRGFLTRLYLCALVIPLGLVGGLIVALVSLSKRALAHRTAIALVDRFCAATPLVLLILLYSGLPFAGVRLTPTAAVCVAFFCNTSSYYGETYRAGAPATLARVILPQAARNVLPDLVSNTIEVVKLTSIASVVSFPELLYSADMARALTLHSSPDVVAAALYVAALWPLVRLVGRLEHGNPSRCQHRRQSQRRSCMSRIVTVAAAQLGGIQKSDTRRQVVARMVELMDRAKERGAVLIVYPELALTTFFPRYYYEDRGEADVWFETAMPGEAVLPLFERAAAHRMAMSFGYAELTPQGRHFNTSILVDREGAIIGKYRKVHLPGHAEFDRTRTHQHLEKRYFEPGDIGFPVWRFLDGIFGMCICNDRRWPETYRVMGLQGVEMIVLGFNTPSSNAQRREEGLEKRLFHHKLSVQAGAYQNSTWVVAVAKAGVEDGHRLFASSLIVNPDGEIVAESRTEGDELLVFPCDLDAGKFGKETIFDFARHRRIEHYTRITSQVGVLPPHSA